LSVTLKTFPENTTRRLMINALRHILVTACQEHNYHFEYRANAAEVEHHNSSGYNSWILFCLLHRLSSRSDAVTRIRTSCLLNQFDLFSSPGSRVTYISTIKSSSAVKNFRAGLVSTV
jgi:hypothetical protein